MEFTSFYRGKKVLVTGDTGFKGSWLCMWLTQMGADVHGLALEPNTTPSIFNVLNLGAAIRHVTVDLRDANAVSEIVRRLKPEIVFHLAAQPIVRLSYTIPLETLDTNVMGTANVLKAITDCGYDSAHPCVVIAVTSDKCYENRESYVAYHEEDRMGGYDIYSASKGMAELLVSSWRRSFFTPKNGTVPPVLLASCRAGNVIGGGDWSPDRIVVDSIRALTENKPIGVRNPLSIRPWQHVLEPLSGYLLVAAAIGSDIENSQPLCSAWNFGPGRESERTVGELCDEIVRHWGAGSWNPTLDSNAVHEARFLKLAIEKAWHLLRWRPAWNFETAIEETANWYRLAHESNYNSQAMRAKTVEQIATYMRDSSNLGRTDAN